MSCINVVLHDILMHPRHCSQLTERARRMSCPTTFFGNNVVWHDFASFPRYKALIHEFLLISSVLYETPRHLRRQIEAAKHTSPHEFFIVPHEFPIIPHETPTRTKAAPNHEPFLPFIFHLSYTHSTRRGSSKALLHSITSFSRFLHQLLELLV